MKLDPMKLGMGNDLRKRNETFDDVMIHLRRDESRLYVVYYVCMLYLFRHRSIYSFLILTSSPCHPKIIREQWCDALMPFHEHGSSDGLFIPGQRHLYCHNSPGKFEHLVHTHVYV